MLDEVDGFFLIILHLFLDLDNHTFGDSCALGVSSVDGNLVLILSSQFVPLFLNSSDLDGDLGDFGLGGSESGSLGGNTSDNLGDLGLQSSSNSGDLGDGGFSSLLDVGGNLGSFLGVIAKFSRDLF